MISVRLPCRAKALGNAIVALSSLSLLERTCFIPTASVVLIIRDRTSRPHLALVELGLALSRNLLLSFLPLAPSSMYDYKPKYHAHHSFSKGSSGRTSLLKKLGGYTSGNAGGNGFTRYSNLSSTSNRLSPKRLADVYQCSPRRE